MSKLKRIGPNNTISGIFINSSVLIQFQFWSCNTVWGINLMNTLSRIIHSLVYLWLAFLLQLFFRGTFLSKALLCPALDSDGAYLEWVSAPALYVGLDGFDVCATSEATIRSFRQSVLSKSRCRFDFVIFSARSGYSVFLSAFQQGVAPLHFLCYTVHVT